MLSHLARVIVFSLFAACASGASSTGISDVSCPPSSTLTYANFGKDMITSECMSCHSTQSPKLGTQAQIQAQTSRILDAAVYTDAMPRNADMTVEQRQLLGEWLACGAP